MTCYVLVCCEPASKHSTWRSWRSGPCSNLSALWIRDLYPIKQMLFQIMIVRTASEFVVSATHFVEGLHDLCDLRMCLRLALPAPTTEQRPDPRDSLLPLVQAQSVLPMYAVCPNLQTKV